MGARRAVGFEWRTNAADFLPAVNRDGASPQLELLVRQRTALATRNGGEEVNIPSG